MTEVVVELRDLSGSHSTGPVLNEPFAESVNQGPVLAPSHIAGAFNGGFVGTEGDVLCTRT